MLKLKILGMTLCLALSGLFLTGCTISGKEITIDVGDSEKEYSSDEIILDNVSVTSANIDNNVGTTTIAYGDDASVEIDISYNVTGNDEDLLEEILDIVSVDAEIENDELRVSVINKETGENIWKWIDREYKSLNKPNLDVDLDILLPADIKEFDINCNVGNINLKSLEGTFDVRSNVGSIEMKDIIFTGDSEITADVGDVTCSLSRDMEEASEVSLTTNIGNVKLDTDDLSYTVEDENNDNFLGTSRTILVNDLCRIDINVSLGKLTLR
jgi:hypothetical protein